MQNNNINPTVDPATSETHSHSQQTQIPQEASAENIYAYYKEQLLPAVLSSFPLLLSQLKNDIWFSTTLALTSVKHFLIPWTKEDFEWRMPDVHVPVQMKNMHWMHGNFTQFLLKNFDTDGDGQISASELLHVKTDAWPPILSQYHNHIQQLQSQLHNRPITWLHWFQSAWPLIDWKIGVFLWRSFGGLLIVIAIATIVPGRLHGLSGRILRWPILAMTYLTITMELIVYILVRLFIRAAETLFTTTKHSKLRSRMETASSYDEWYNLAKELDESQGRDKWQETINDDTSYKYNWTFINELISDMKRARKNCDMMKALSILQQCTRKNVGGIMSEDLFSFTNTGEPKKIVKDFLEEVVVTLKWITEQANAIPPLSDDDLDANNENEDEDEDEIDFTGKNGDLQNAKSDDSHKSDEKNIIENVVGFGFAVADWAFSTIHVDRKIAKQKVAESIERMQTQNNDNMNGGKRVEINGLRSLQRKKELEQREEVKSFLRRARAAYGRTALCLSGGAMMGCYHFGHVKALLDEKVLPQIISGTSAGSVIAAILCTRNDEEIERDLVPEILVKKLTCFSRAWRDRFKSLYTDGCMFDNDEWLRLITWFCCGDLTFEEAYKKTGRVLCITLSATTKKAPPVLVNYITAPNVTIASAVVASAAVPFFIKPCLLKVKIDGKVRNQEENKDQTYWDGSIEKDIPTSGLAEVFNCQFFLAAQCNPHIVPFFHNSKGDVGCPSRWTRGMRHDSWRGGFLLAALEMYLKSDMRAKFHFLNDLEAAVGFTSTMMTQVYGGTTTIVPQISFFDYFKLFSNPSLPFLKQCFQVGSIAAYRHCAMMKQQYSIVRALDESLAILERPEMSQCFRRKSSMAFNENSTKVKRGRDYSLNASVLIRESFDEANTNSSSTSTQVSQVSSYREDYETMGFDGVEVDHSPDSTTH